MQGEECSPPQVPLLGGSLVRNAQPRRPSHLFSRPPTTNKARTTKHPCYDLQLLLVRARLDDTAAAASFRPFSPLSRSFHPTFPWFRRFSSSCIPLRNSRFFCVSFGHCAPLLLGRQVNAGVDQPQQRRGCPSKQYPGDDLLTSLYALRQPGAAQLRHSGWPPKRKPTRSTGCTPRASFRT